MAAKRKKYKFSSDWFSEWTPVWRDVLSSFTGKKNVSYLEVGTFEGRSLIWMFDNILTGETCRATVIDPFFDDLKDIFTHNINLSGHAGKVNLIEGYSQENLKKLADCTFDIIYLDGSHKANAILADLVLSWDLLKTNGILIIDDYMWKHGEIPIDQCPKTAVDCFLTFYGEELDIVYADYQLYLKKKMKSTYAHGNEKSFLKENIYFHWGWWKLFKLSDNAVKVIRGDNRVSVSEDEMIGEEIPLERSEILTIAKFLSSKKLGQHRPDFNFLNKEERKLVKQYSYPVK